MISSPTVLIVDDSESNRELMTEYLRPERCRILTSTDGGSAAALARLERPDLVLVDFQMPGMNGLELTAQLRRESQGSFLPIVMISGFTDVAHRVAALEAGADDFLFKPVEGPELTARVRSLLHLQAMHRRLEETQHVVFTLGKAVEAKDSFTQEHTERVAGRARALASRLGFGAAEIDQIHAGALIHDIGKLAIPDGVLNKPGPLTAEEFEIVKRHCVIGAEIVAPLSSQPELLAIVRHHHERYDGAGYPDGLAGETIPLAARVVAICDAFDAMSSDRPYRSAFTPQHACELMLGGRGSQWDGPMVDAFVEVVQDTAATLN